MFVCILFLVWFLLLLFFFFPKFFSFINYFLLSSAAQKFKMRTNVNFPQFETTGVQSLFGICITAPTKGSVSSSGFPIVTGTAKEPAGTRWCQTWLTSWALPPSPTQSPTPWAHPVRGKQGEKGLQGSHSTSAQPRDAPGAPSPSDRGAQEPPSPPSPLPTARSTGCSQHSSTHCWVPHRTVCSPNAAPLSI